MMETEEAENAQAREHRRMTHHKTTCHIACATAVAEVSPGIRTAAGIWRGEACRQRRARSDC